MGQGAPAIGQSRPLVLLLRSWWSNSAAEACAGLSWFLLAAALFAGSLALALPFGAARWREASAAASTASWPGLGAAFLELAAKGGDWKVSKGHFIPDPSAPSALAAGGWTLRLGEAGEPSRDSGRMLWLGRDSLALVDSVSRRSVSAGWELFEGFDAALLKRAAANRPALTTLIEGLLQLAATSALPSSLLTLALLMLTQNLLFIAVLGFLLSLSVLASRVEVPGGRRYRLVPSLKVAIAITAGPAFLAGLLGFLLPLLAAFVWLGYSLLAGLRSVILYAARYKSLRASRLPSSGRA